MSDSSLTDLLQASCSALDSKTPALDASTAHQLGELVDDWQVSTDSKSITKQFKFELAHRLVDSYSVKCQSVHGHSYLCEVTLAGEHLDNTGMLMDFGEVKDNIAHLFDAWDMHLFCIVLLQ